MKDSIEIRFISETLLLVKTQKYEICEEKKKKKEHFIVPLHSVQGVQVKG